MHLLSGKFPLLTLPRKNPLRNSAGRLQSRSLLPIFFASSFQSTRRIRQTAETVGRLNPLPGMHSRTPDEIPLVRDHPSFQTNFSETFPFIFQCKCTPDQGPSLLRDHFSPNHSTALGSCGRRNISPICENTELKGFPFKAWGRSVYSHTCYANCQGFLPC